MSTYFAKEHEIERKWWIIDATDLKLGRMASQIAQVLRGKNKPQYTPHSDTGDFVIVINAEKIVMTGQKWDQKSYYRHSRFFGSLKEKSASQMREFDPAFVIEDAVKGMLPKNKLARQLLTKLKAYKGGEHPHAAQKPQALTFN
jgi:large subunit ribosomal protein L13